MSKIETTSVTEASQQDKLWRARRARAELSTLDADHKLPHSPEGANSRPQRTQFPQEPLISPLGLQNRLQMAIIDYH